MSRHTLWIILILIFYGITGSLYIINVPLFEASDEAEHFIYIHTILETGELPVIQSRDEMANQTDPILRWNNQSHHAPLYYMMSALIVSWSERADLADYLHPNELIFLRNTVEDNPNKWLHRYTEPTSDTHIAVYVLRVVNLLMGAGTLAMVYLTAKQLNDNRSLPLLAMLLTASIPTFIVVNSSVTNDALVIFLYSAGIYWTLKAWRTEKFTLIDMISISLILGGIALTKLTGVTLFGVVYLALLAGIFRKKWSFQQATQVVLITGLSAALLAGWWYIRNYQVYGDLLAIDATASIWGRETALTLSMLPDELLRIGKSFWMLIGYLHFPVFAPDVFYIYAGLISVLGVIGFAIYTIRQKDRDLLWIMLFACFVVTAMLFYGTLSVDISYGRLLLPAIAAFAPLVVIGWQQVMKRAPLILIAPLIITTVAVPLLLVPMAYSNIEVGDAIPDEATAVNWQVENLEMLAIDVSPATVSTGDTLTVDLYFRGNHPDNPALTVTAVDTIRVQRFDHIEIYPGMADMRQLPDDRIFRTRIFFAITEPDTVLPPRAVNILVKWIDLDTDEALVFDSGLSLLEIQGATYMDDDYQAPQFGNTVDINFGDEIILRDYAIPEIITAGETVSLSFIWEAGEQILRDNEAILTMQLFDSEGDFILQNDGALWWYPTTLWAENIPFEDARSLELPSDLAPGDYQLRLGWYRVIDETYPRLPVLNSEHIDNLYAIPLSITAD